MPSGSINSELWIGCFPSQNPILAPRNSEEPEFGISEESLALAAKAYYDWYDLRTLQKNSLEKTYLDELYLIKPG